MGPQDFRRIALGMDAAVEGSHMGHPDFRVNGKIFATIHPDHQWGMVKLTPEQQNQFVHDHPSTFGPESGAWGRAGCTRVHLASVDEGTLGEAMTLAWQNIARLRSVQPPAASARQARLRSVQPPAASARQARLRSVQRAAASARQARLRSVHPPAASAGQAKNGVAEQSKPKRRTGRIRR